MYYQTGQGGIQLRVVEPARLRCGRLFATDASDTHLLLEYTKSMPKHSLSAKVKATVSRRAVKQLNYLTTLFGHLQKDQRGAVFFADKTICCNHFKIVTAYLTSEETLATRGTSFGYPPRLPLT